MSLFSLGLAGEIAAARKALRLADPHPAWLAVNRAADCLADLERAERLLDSERASAEAASAALDRALQLFDIEAEQQRRAAEIAAAPDSPAEIARRAAANKRRLAALNRAMGGNSK